jgi:hypothetical protein
MNDKGNVHDFNQLEYLLGMNGVAKKYDVAIAYRISVRCCFIRSFGAFEGC